MDAPHHRVKRARLIDLSGQTFGRWQVLSRGPNMNGKPGWLCRCQCGTEKHVSGSNLRLALSLSCGCYSRELTGEMSRTHGGSGYSSERHPNYVIWQGMKNRCRDASNPKYGGRGITICARWLEGEDGKTGFECFIEDMGVRPSKLHSIDRRDNDGNYEPANCRWRTPKEQARNTSQNRFIKCRGVLMQIGDACDTMGLKSSTFYQRTRPDGARQVNET
jgi:hypothetical protein